MERSSQQTLVKILKISTWVFIAIVLFLFYVSFRSPYQEEQQKYTYYSFVALIIGYACNFGAKWLNRKLNKEND